MLSTESEVDVILGLWKNIGLRTEIFGLITCRREGRKTHSMDPRRVNLHVKQTATKVG